MRERVHGWRMIVVPMVTGVVLQSRVVQSAAILLARLLGDARVRWRR